jgi:hypothetical protein
MCSPAVPHTGQTHMAYTQQLKLGARDMQAKLVAQIALLDRTGRAEARTADVNVYDRNLRRSIFGIQCIQKCADYLHALIDDFRMCYESENYAARPGQLRFPSRTQVDAAVVATTPMPPQITAWTQPGGHAPMTPGLRAFLSLIMISLRALHTVREKLEQMSTGSTVKDAIGGVQYLFNTCQRYMNACLSEANLQVLGEHLEHVLALEEERTQERQLTFSMVDHPKGGVGAGGWASLFPTDVTRHISDLVAYDPGPHASVTSRAIQRGFMPAGVRPRIL